MSITLTPSLPAATFDELTSLATVLAHVAPMLQVDIVDGIFAPAKSWPFTESGNPHITLERLRELPASLPIEIDAMVMYPENYLDTLASLNVASVIVHMRSTDAYEAIISHARAHGYQIGFAVTNDIPLTELAPYIPHIDFVQVMGIAHVGTQGQPFDPRTLQTLRTLRELHPALPLTVDGAVNENTVRELVDAGATRLAPGSAIATAHDPALAYEQLKALI